MSGELKPCAFCGGEASYGEVKYSRPLCDANWADGSDIIEAFYINCVRCAGGTRNSIAGGHQTKELAAAAWNTRVADPQVAALTAQVERLRAVLESAQKHIQAMQHQCCQYVEPSGYTAFDRKRIAFKSDREAKDSLFIDDMIYLLDGPEQRAVQSAITAALARSHE